MKFWKKLRGKTVLGIGKREYLLGQDLVLVQVVTDGEFINLVYQPYDKWREGHRLP